MEDSFDSIYIIRKDLYDEFMKDVSKLALTAYTVPAFVRPELYKLVDMKKDIAMSVIWKTETTVKQIKELDRKWFLERY